MKHIAIGDLHGRDTWQQANANLYDKAIPADDELSRLSAILMDGNYYNFMIEHSVDEDGLHRANTEALICLKRLMFFAWQ